MKTYKFKINSPSKTIIQKFEKTLEVCRELYNAALFERCDAYKLRRISLNYYDQSSQLKDIRLIREDVRTVYSQILQDVLRRLEKTFKAFFQCVKNRLRTGFPKFKGENRYHSFTFPQANGSFRLEDNVLFLSKIGKVKLHLSRNMIGKIKTCTIKREVSGWFVIFAVESSKILLPKTYKSIGIDVGIENFLTLSNGEQIPNLKFFESSQKDLKRVQRSLSRKKRGSNSWRKTLTHLRKIHQKIMNQRIDFAHKLSTRIIREFDLIVIEDLKILTLSRGLFSKQIRDVAWSAFFQKLEYKAKFSGKKVIKVNPNGTSQTCICNASVPKNLSLRWHCCLNCGYSNHRDIVSAQVILSLGLRDLDLTKTVGL